MRFGFEGDIRKYPQFRSEFIKFIEPKCEDYMLAFVLKSYLSEKVQEEISNVCGDYIKMWERLDCKYGNVGMLIDTILFDVKNLDTTNGSSSEETIKMINTIEKAARDLDFLDHQSSTTLQPFL